MKTKFTLTLIFLFSFKVFANSNLFNIQERIESRKFSKAIVPLLINEPLIMDNHKFQSAFKKLNKQEAKIFHKNLNKLNPYLPALLLRGVLTYRFLKPNNDHLKNILLYTLFQKLFIIRDIIDDPEKSESRIPLKLLRKVTEISKIDTNQIFLSLKNIYEEKVKFIVSLENHETFLEALISTPLLTINIQKHLKREHLTLLDYTGIIPGNQIRQGQNLSHRKYSQKVKSIISSAKKTLFLNLGIFEQDSNLKIVEFLVNKLKIYKESAFNTLILHPKNVSKITSNQLKVLSFLKKNNPPNLLLVEIPEDFHQLEKSNEFLKMSSPHKNISFILKDSNSINAEGIFSSDYSRVYQIKGPYIPLKQSYILSNLNNKRLSAKEFDKFNITIKNMPYLGKESIRFLENSDIYTSKRTLINSIRTAKKNIYLKQDFIYDPHIVDSLIKSKIKNPEIDIKIIINDSRKFREDGLPNTIFIQDFNKYKIDLRVESLLYEKSFENYVAIDGKILIKTAFPITIPVSDTQENHNDFLIYSKQLSTAYNSRFLSSWQNTITTKIINLEHFRLKTKNGKLSNLTSRLINRIGAFYLRAIK